jgi:SAM-dependent methyltransferase
MNAIAKRGVVHNPAEVYDELFVPALFRQWGPVVSEAAGVRAGQSVLDVACGTGALTCAVALRVGSSGAVVGLDANQEMLEVARRKSTNIDWREGRAEALPFADESFDGVVSQFGLMFFDDRPRALREMMRVLRPGGRMAVAVWDSLERSPGYATLAARLEALFGEQVLAAFRAPYSLGDPDVLMRLSAEAGLLDARLARHIGSVRFSSIESLVATERACAWTLGGMLDDEQFERLLADAEGELKHFVGADGWVTFATPALIVTAAKQ